jgi:hypothetical protein
MSKKEGAVKAAPFLFGAVLGAGRKAVREIAEKCVRIMNLFETSRKGLDTGRKLHIIDLALKEIEC